MPSHPSLALTASPDFMKLARKELHRTALGSMLLELPAPDIALYALDDQFCTLAEVWQAEPPVFTRHIHPVQLAIPLPGTTADPHILQQAAVREFAPLFDEALPFAVQARVVGKRPYKALAINRAVAEQLETRTGAALNVRAPKQILSILVSGDSAYCGLSLAWQNLSDWPGGEHRFARRKEQISRAEFKLLEAWSKFNLDLPPYGRALDLGAAPGGWTRVLREKEQVVTAIDPGQLHPQLAADKNVRHLPITAEAYLAQGPDQFDLIVNDMRLDARDSARILNKYARFLYRQGLALMTLKLPGNRAAQTMRQALEILGKKYEVTHARQLFHNRQEITLLLRPRQERD